MKQKLIRLSQQYVAVLRKYLKQEPRARRSPAFTLGHRAVALGLETMDLARIHEQALVALELADNESGLKKRAEVFFIEAIIPIVETHHVAQQNKMDLNRLKITLTLRTKELADTNRQLQRDVARRKAMKNAFAKKGRHYQKCLEESLELQRRLRQLAHRVLAAQEDERKKISHELQDEIAQTLLGINVRLFSLKQEAKSNIKGLRNEIASTQRLVVKSASSVRRAGRKIGNL